MVTEWQFGGLFPRHKRGSPQNWLEVTHALPWHRSRSALWDTMVLLLDREEEEHRPSFAVRSGTSLPEAGPASARKLQTPTRPSGGASSSFFRRGRRRRRRTLRAKGGDATMASRPGCAENRLVSLPLSRIRVIMKSSPEVSSINPDAIFLTAKATVAPMPLSSFGLRRCPMAWAKYGI